MFVNIAGYSFLIMASFKATFSELPKIITLKLLFTLVKLIFAFVKTILFSIKSQLASKTIWINFIQ